jgi:hypothetical protein
MLSSFAMEWSAQVMGPGTACPTCLPLVLQLKLKLSFQIDFASKNSSLWSKGSYSLDGPLGRRDRRCPDTIQGHKTCRQRNILQLMDASAAPNAKRILNATKHPFWSIPDNDP